MAILCSDYGQIQIYVHDIAVCCVVLRYCQHMMDQANSQFKAEQKWSLTEQKMQSS